MSIIKTTTLKCKCDRCGHTWTPENQHTPEQTIRCPNCGSPYWNKKRKKA